jgi:hypothetical protein
VYPPSKIFTELVNKNALKHKKDLTSLPKRVSQPLYTLPEIWQKPHGPSPGIFELIIIRSSAPVCVLRTRSIDP